MTNAKKVTQTGNSKNGNPYVCLDGDDTRYYVSQKITPPSLGQIIETDTTSKRFQNAKYDTWFLNGWKPVAQQANGAPVTTVTEKLYDYKAPALNPGGWAIDAGDCSRLLSNVLASCIAAGLIKEPEQMAGWVDRVYAYVNGVRTGKIVSFDDKLWPADEPKTGLAGSIEDGEPPYQADF